MFVDSLATVHPAPQSIAGFLLHSQYCEYSVSAISTAFRRAQHKTNDLYKTKTYASSSVKLSLLTMTIIGRYKVYNVNKLKY